MLKKYIMTREMQTRKKALDLWRLKEWSWGEAMTNIYSQDMDMFWTLTGQNNSYGVRVSIPGSPMRSTAMCGRP